MLLVMSLTAMLVRGDRGFEVFESLPGATDPALSLSKGFALRNQVFHNAGRAPTASIAQSVVHTDFCFDGHRFAIQ